MTKEMLDSEILRARIMQTEYDHLTEKDVRRIYVEETRKDPPAHITVYHSKTRGQDSGFDGTVIHFYDEKRKINQAYTIMRGSETPSESDSWKPLDWVYNLFGIFVGQSKSQFEDAERFDKKITNKINKKVGTKITLKKYGLGHSLGGNLIEMLQLRKGQFRNVNVINDAPPSYYQLAFIDDEFWNEIVHKFNLNRRNYKSIYKVNHNALKKFAEDYYKDRGDNIHHFNTKDDIMTAASIVPGFFRVGTPKKPEVNPDGVRKLIQPIPAKDVLAIQQYLAQYEKDYNEKGFDGVVQGMTGINLELFKYDHWYEVPFTGARAARMYGEMAVKIPKLLGKIGLLIKNMDPILQALVETDYITPDQKKEIEQDVHGIKKDLEGMIPNLLPGPGFAINEMVLFMETKGLIDRFKEIKEDLTPLMQAFANSINAHGLEQVINSLKKNKDSYEISYNENGDMFLDNGKIKVNLSSVLRIYQKGMEKIDEQKDALKQYKTVFHQEFTEDYILRRKSLLTKIHDMEANPKSYQFLLNKNNHSVVYDKKLVKITVHESIQDLNSEAIEHTFEAINKQIQDNRQLMTDMKSSVEDYFKKDKQLSKMFDLVEAGGK